jgi:hypothetical protein
MALFERGGVRWHKFYFAGQPIPGVIQVNVEDGREEY